MRSYYFFCSKKFCQSNLNEESINVIHNVSSLTHARSLIACGIYSFIAVQPLKVYPGVTLYLQALITQKIKPNFITELEHYSRLFDKDFAALPEYEIESSGYVVSTLEAVLWFLLNTGNYKELVLKAVNLGGDTDTIAAIAGGIAGIYYGLTDIPKDWLPLLKINLA